MGISDTVRAVFGHAWTVTKHRHYVFLYCCKAGIPLRGLVHDLSKFSPVEFFESVKFYQGGKSSPINAAKKAQGYSLAWQHHKGRNTHHYEYWVDYLDDGGRPIKMPYNDLKELICDYLGAARAYNGKSFTFRDEYKWWLTKYDERAGYHMKMHPETAKFINAFFTRIYNRNNFSSSDFDEVRRKLDY